MVGNGEDRREPGMRGYWLGVEMGRKSGKWGEKCRRLGTRGKAQEWCLRNGRMWTAEEWVGEGEWLGKGGWLGKIRGGNGWLWKSRKEWMVGEGGEGMDGCGMVVKGDGEKRMNG